jgi:hypothetical protein
VFGAQETMQNLPTHHLRLLRKRRLVAGELFNQPKLCPNASWNSVALTFANSSTVGVNPQTIFIDTNNTIYIGNQENGTVQVWLEGSTSPTGAIATYYNQSRALFVSIAKDVYIDSESSNYSVTVWRENATSSFSSLTIGEHCYSLFLPIDESLYCSMHDSHKVIKRSLDSSDTQVTIVAGTGCAGYFANRLYNPRGIFVTVDLDLYVADTNNHRVQLFRAGQLSGTTMAGKEALGTLQLFNPAAVMLDGDGYLFILDSNNFRIVASGPYGFRCVVACTNVRGSASDQLSSNTCSKYEMLSVIADCRDRDCLTLFWHLGPLSTHFYRRVIFQERCGR